MKNPYENIDLKVFGKRLADAINHLPISREVLAQEFNFSLDDLHSWESGEQPTPPIILGKMAHEYGIEIAFLFHGHVSEWYASKDEAIEAYLEGDLGEAFLSEYLGVHLVEARRIVQEYEDAQDAKRQ